MIIILFILFDSDMIEGIIYYLKEKKESELVKRDCAVSENKVLYNVNYYIWNYFGSSSGHTSLEKTRK